MLLDTAIAQLKHEVKMQQIGLSSDHVILTGIPKQITLLQQVKTSFPQAP
jgi:hypothetical protein